MTSPRATFKGHVLTTHWDHLQLAYFTGYAMWTYNTEPYSFTLPGVVTEELGRWTDEDGAIFDRLAVIYPESIATHTPTQILYANPDGVLQRRDYTVDIAGESPSVEYMTEQKMFDGLCFPDAARSMCAMGMVGLCAIPSLYRLTSTT